MSDGFLKKNGYCLLALLSYITVVILFTDLSDTYQLVVLVLTILTLPLVFNYKIMKKNIWISILAGASISFYLSPSGFHIVPKGVNSYITFPHQAQFCFWAMILMLNTLHSIHRNVNQTRLSKIKETLADKRDDVIDEILTPVRSKIKKIDYFL